MFSNISKKTFFLLPALFLSSYVIGAGAGSLTSAAAEGNWGLSFAWRKSHQPTANASTDELAQYDAYYMQDTDEKILYLTFDAGYENGNTEKILDVLKKHDVSAAFFVVGTYIESNPWTRQEDVQGRTHRRKPYMASSWYVANVNSWIISKRINGCRENI